MKSKIKKFVKKSQRDKIRDKDKLEGQTRMCLSKMSLRKRDNIRKCPCPYSIIFRDKTRDKLDN
ncbi:hypothetical protein SuUB58_16750 [Streptococcus uberis]